MKCELCGYEHFEDNGNVQTYELGAVTNFGISYSLCLSCLRSYETMMIKNKNRREIWVEYDCIEAYKNYATSGQECKFETIKTISTRIWELNIKMHDDIQEWVKRRKKECETC